MIMRTILIWIGRLGLLLTFLPAVLLCADVVTFSTTKLLMVVGMVLWFISAPISQHMAQESS